MGRQQKSGLSGFIFCISFLGAVYSEAALFLIINILHIHYYQPVTYSFIKKQTDLYRSVSLLAPRHLSDQAQVAVQRPLLRDSY